MCPCLGVPRVPGNVGTEEAPRFHTQTVCAFRMLGNVVCLSLGFQTGDGKETDRKWEEGGEISVLEFAATEYGRRTKVVASEEVRTAIQKIGINKCARESVFDRKNFVRRLVRNMPVKRNSYQAFVRWLEGRHHAPRLTTT
jgi:hypothetical protein